MNGESCPVENTSYKGYSPPKCSCNVHSTFHNHIPTRTCQFYMESYMSCHEMRYDSPCTMRPSSHRLPHTTLQPMCDKPSFWMTSNDHFIFKIHFMFKIMRLCVGSRFLVSHYGLRKPRHFYDLSPLRTMSDHNWQAVHSRADLSLFADT